MEPQATGIKTWQWVVTVIVIIVLVIIGYNIFSNGDSAMTGDEGSMTSDTAMTGSKDINRIVVSDQYPGNVVYISSVMLAQPGWVEIHKDNNGQPGAIIGSMYFDKGTNPGKITLTTPTVEGGIYYAMIHSDNGDKKFDASKDLPLKDAAGNIIMKLFRASSTVTEVKG